MGSKEDNISESVTSRILHSVNRRDSNIIIVIGLIGVLLFLMFIVNLLIWAKRRNKSNEIRHGGSQTVCFPEQMKSKFKTEKPMENPPSYDVVVGLDKFDEELPTYIEA